MRMLQGAVIAAGISAAPIGGANAQPECGKINTVREHIPIVGQHVESGKDAMCLYFLENGFFLGVVEFNYQTGNQARMDFARISRNRSPLYYETMSYGGNDVAMFISEGDMHEDAYNIHVAARRSGKVKAYMTVTPVDIGASLMRASFRQAIFGSAAGGKIAAELGPQGRRDFNRAMIAGIRNSLMDGGAGAPALAGELARFWTGYRHISGDVATLLGQWAADNLSMVRLALDR